jgi:hypothetical protein
LVRTTAAGFSESRAACSALMMMLPLLGRMTTCRPGHWSMAFRMSSALGFMVWPPLMTQAPSS